MDLLYNGAPVQFVFKTIEAIDLVLGGIEDIPHRHNYYTVIWPFTATGKHIIDFKEYPISRDQIFFVSPWQVHQVITDRGPAGYVLLFTTEFLAGNSIRNDFIANLKLFQNTDETPSQPVDEKMASD